MIMVIMIVGANGLTGELIKSKPNQAYAHK